MAIGRPLRSAFLTQSRNIFAFRPRASVTAATDTPGCSQAPTASALKRALWCRPRRRPVSITCFVVDICTPNVTVKRHPPTSAASLTDDLARRLRIYFALIRRKRHTCENSASTQQELTARDKGSVFGAASSPHGLSLTQAASVCFSAMISPSSPTASVGRFLPVCSPESGRTAQTAEFNGAGLASVRQRSKPTPFCRS